MVFQTTILNILADSMKISSFRRPSAALLSLGGASYRFIATNAVFSCNSCSNRKEAFAATCSQDSREASFCKSTRFRYITSMFWNKNPPMPKGPSQTSGFLLMGFLQDGNKKRFKFSATDHIENVFQKCFPPSEMTLFPCHSDLF